MHANETEHLAERLLNAALAGYAAEEPRAGLEQRVFARLSTAPQPSGWWAWRSPVGALALVALLALALLLPRQETTRVAAPPSPAPSRAASTPLRPAFSTAEASSTRPPVRAPQSSALVRAGQFPTPGSLTEQERLLMRYLQSSPREVLVAAVRSPGPLFDLQVRDVEVPMLELRPLPESAGEAMEN